MPHPLFKSSERNLSYLLYLVTGVVFMPVINWLLNQTVAHDQLLHAFIVLIFTGALIIYERGIKLSWHGKLDGWSQNLLVASFALLVIAVFTHNSLIILMSLSLSIGSFLWFLLGAAHKRFILSGLVAFSLFAAIALFQPVLDWPLRAIAGKWAATGLSLVGQSTDLRVLLSGEAPRLILFNNDQTFHVAAECNGFGMLSSCMLMTTFIILFRRMRAWVRIGIFIASILYGLACNMLRITIIVLLAPRIPYGRYDLMHETIGIVVTYGGLLLLYLAVMPRRAGQRDGATPG